MDASPADAGTEGPAEVQLSVSEPGPTVEDRVEAWVRIASSVVALVWMIDIATHGDLSYRVAYRWRQIKKRWRDERAARNAGRRAVFEAMVILEEAP